MFRVCLIFYTYIRELQKASGITPWKKCYSLLRWPCLLQDVLNRRLLFKTNRSSSTKGNHHPSFLSVSGIGQKKTVDAAKICGGAENVVKTETQQTFVNGLLGFITLGIYTPLEARVYCSHRMSCPSIWATLSAPLINILLGSFQLFLHSDQPLSEGEIIPFSGVCQSGRLHYPRRRRWWLHALTDRLLWCATDDDQRHIITQTSFSALASANSFVYFASSAATHHADASACQ